MDSNLGIYIPSRGRSKVINKGVIAQLLGNLPIYLVVPDREVEEYKSVAPEHVGVLHCEAEGIATTRQWILENADEPYILYMSDDVQISHRNEESKLKTSSVDDVQHMLSEIKRLLNSGYAHVGVSQRAFNHATLKSYMEITRMNDVYAYRKNDVLKSGARFDDLKVMEDFDVTLTLLELGFPNIVLYNYAWSQRKSGESGGCSSYRTWKMQREAAFKLAERHPGCVKIVTKKSKTTWENVGAHRVDVNINWKKAYRPKCRTEKSGVAEFFK